MLIRESIKFLWPVRTLVAPTTTGLGPQQVYLVTSRVFDVQAKTLMAAPEAIRKAYEDRR
jgi:hypothetical protein